MRTLGLYASSRKLTRRGATQPARDGTVRTTRNTDFGHLPQIEHFVDLIVGQHVLALDEIANEDVLLDRLLAQLRGARVADLRRERGRERGRSLDPVRAHLAIRLDALDASAR